MQPGQSARTGPARNASGGASRPPLAGTIVRLLVSLTVTSPWEVVAVVAMTLGLTLTSGVGLLMLVPLLQVAGLEADSGSIGHIARIAAGFIDRLGLSPNLPVVVGIYLVVVASGALLQRAHSVRTTLLYQSHIVQLRRRLFEAITHCRWESYLRQRGSRFTHMLTHELERIGSGTGTLLNLIVKTLVALIYLAIALVLSPLTTIIVLACGAVLALLLARKTALGRAKGEEVSAAYEAMFASISEHLDGMRVSKSHGVEEHHLDRFRERTARSARSLIEVVRNRADVSFWLETGSAVILASIFFVALRVLALPLAGILMLIYVFARLVPMVMNLQRQLHRLLDVIPAFDRFEALMAELAAETEPYGAPGEPLSLQRGISLEGVSFGYGGGAVLEHVSLEIPAGRTTAIVGPSGSGKSTIADLLVGLLAPDTGTIAIDSVPLDGPRVPAWRRQIGYVNQDNFLFNASVRENLLLVQPDASQEELESALQAASADFVHRLPHGMDTLVGDRGTRLSGGERQRISLARALLRNPDLLVLDEATSSLDAHNEAAIQRAIERMQGNLTIVVIAHRLATVRSADLIHLIENGKVTETGDWEQLIQDDHGRFRELCLAQGLLASRVGARPRP